MKKLVLLSAIMASGLLSTTANAQIGVSLGMHFGGNRGPVGHVVVATPPVYTEPVVYNNYDDYYYLPDVGAYYSVSEQAYYYNNGGRWMSAAYLPGYRNYDWHTARRFEVHANRPYLNHDYYRSRFAGNRGGWDRGRNFNDRGGFRGNEHFNNRNDFRNGPGRGPEQHFDNRGGRPQGGFDRGNGNRPQPGPGGHGQQGPGGHERGNGGGGLNHRG